MYFNVFRRPNHFLMHLGTLDFRKYFRGSCVLRGAILSNEVGALTLTAGIAHVKIMRHYSFIPSNKWDNSMLILIGEKSRLPEGCDSLRKEYSFMENSDTDSCSVGSHVRLLSLWHGSHGLVNPLHEYGTGVGLTKKKIKQTISSP